MGTDGASLETQPKDHAAPWEESLGACFFCGIRVARGEDETEKETSGDSQDVPPRNRERGRAVDQRKKGQCEPRERGARGKTEEETVG